MMTASVACPRHVRFRGTTQLGWITGRGEEQTARIGRRRTGRIGVSTGGERTIAPQSQCGIGSVSRILAAKLGSASTCTALSWILASVRTGPPKQIFAFARSSGWIRPRLCENPSAKSRCRISFPDCRYGGRIFREMGLASTREQILLHQIATIEFSHSLDPSATYRLAATGGSSASGAIVYWHCIIRLRSTLSSCRR
jgi:hypothetical protein